MLNREIKKILTAGIITVSVALAVSVAWILGGFDYLEYKTYDLRVNLFAAKHPPIDNIIVVLLDQGSIDWAMRERGWSWPWPRSAYGEILDYMNTAGAAAVAFDVLFSEPSVYGPDDDAAYSRAANEFGRTVQAVFFNANAGTELPWPVGKPFFTTEGFDQLSLRVEARRGVQLPIPGLLASAGAAGTVTGTPDFDDLFRRASLFTLFDDKAVPGLAAAVLLASGHDTRLSYDAKKRVIMWEDYVIPVDEQGRSLLRFRGSLDRYIPYSAAAILQSAESYRKGEEPLLWPEDFTDRYVFFGYNAPGLFDICATPISSAYPGVGMHVTLLDNLLSQDFIRESPRYAGILISLAVVAFITFLVLYKSVRWTTGGVVICLIVLCGIALLAYNSANLWLPVVAPISGLFSAFLVSTLYSYVTEGRSKQFIKSAFSQYLSPSVIEQLLADPGRLTLGGERRQISIFFSDIQGFTSISERLDPTELSELLNAYLSLVTDAILESGGTIDKYEGDAIIAFWNAPLNYANHAARALGAALTCQRLLAEHRASFEEKSGDPLHTRIGLNTGYAVVGNMGSSKRFDYTMLGDSVNLAARLEGLNKQFGTYLMCTEETFRQARDAAAFSARKLALVTVVGKKEPVTVYEPMDEALFQEKREILADFDKARDLFYQGDFTVALPLFEAIASVDRPSYYYAEQCRHYEQHPEEWQGYWRAMTK